MSMGLSSKPCPIVIERLGNFLSAHSLGSLGKLVQEYLYCGLAEFGYSARDMNSKPTHRLVTTAETVEYNPVGKMILRPVPA